MRHKVLLVDDEEHILELGMTALSRDADYEMLLARNGIEALQICASEQPALVFLDLMMPAKDGFAVCRELKQDPSTARIQVIVLSASAQESIAQQAFAAGADGFMSKPFRPSELRQKAHEFLTTARSARQ